MNINTILAQPCNLAADRYGASMGRRNRTEGEPERLHLQKMRVQDYGYDVGGAYWGCDSSSGSMWCAFSPKDTLNEFPIRVFVRALDREAAKAAVLACLPAGDWRWFR